MKHYILKGSTLCGVARGRWDSWASSTNEVTCPDCLSILATGQGVYRENFGEEPRNHRKELLMPPPPGKPGDSFKERHAQLSNAIDERLTQLQAIFTFRLNGLPHDRLPYLQRNLTHAPRLLEEVQKLIGEFEKLGL